VVVIGGGYAFKLWRDRQKPPFCDWCGLSSHAPQSEMSRPCPRNPEGKMGHHFKITIGAVAQTDG